MPQDWNLEEKTAVGISNIALYAYMWKLCMISPEISKSSGQGSEGLFQMLILYLPIKLHDVTAQVNSNLKIVIFHHMILENTDSI
jgi:hypothetical protein